MPVLEVALITPPLLTLKYVGLLTESVWKSIWGKQGCAIWCPLQSIQNHLRYLMYHHPMQKTDNVNQYRASYQASALIESPRTVQWGTQLLLNFVSILHFEIATSQTNSVYSLQPLEISGSVPDRKIDKNQINTILIHRTLLKWEFCVAHIWFWFLFFCLFLSFSYKISLLFQNVECSNSSHLKKCLLFLKIGEGGPKQVLPISINKLSA